MPARSRARRRALEVLFAAELRSVSPLEVLAEVEARTDAASPLHPYVSVLVHGVLDNLAELDAALNDQSHEWDLGRMPAVDRNVLRIGAFELRSGDVPVNAVLSEAVAIVRELSTDESPKFVNGLLGALAGDRA